MFINFIEKWKNTSKNKVYWKLWSIKNYLAEIRFKMLCCINTKYYYKITLSVWVISVNYNTYTTRIAKFNHCILGKIIIPNYIWYFNTATILRNVAFLAYFVLNAYLLHISYIIALFFVQKNLSFVYKHIHKYLIKIYVCIKQKINIRL